MTICGQGMDSRISDWQELLTPWNKAVITEEPQRYPRLGGHSGSALTGQKPLLSSPKIPKNYQQEYCDSSSGIFVPAFSKMLPGKCKGAIKRGNFHLMPGEEGVWGERFKLHHHPKIWERISWLGNQTPKRGSWEKSFSRVTESSGGMVAELSKDWVWWKKGIYTQQAQGRYSRV